MAGHSKGCSDSARLCDKLHIELRERVSNLEYKQGANKCSFGISGARKIFAWVNTHGRREPKIEIWFLGDLAKTARFDRLEIRPRKKTQSSWDDYHGRFDIADAFQLEQAVDLLVSVACPASR